MAATTLPLSIIADVTVVTSTPQVAAPTFNTALVVGPTPAIPSYGANSRVRQYLAATYSTAMLTDGFTNTSPEYLCAELYFSQSPQPQRLDVGRQDLTGMHTVAPTAASEGIGYNSQSTQQKIADGFRAAFNGKVPYEWQVDVTEALILGLDCILIMGMGLERQYPS